MKNKVLEYSKDWPRYQNVIDLRKKEPEDNLLAHIGVIIGEALLLMFVFGVVMLWVIALN